MKLLSGVANVPEHSQKLASVGKRLTWSLPGDTSGEQAEQILVRTVAALEAAVAKARENQRLSQTSIGIEEVFANEEPGAEFESDQATSAFLLAKVESALRQTQRELRKYRPVSISNHEATELLSSYSQYLERADFLRALGDNTNAIRDYSAAIELEPMQTPPYMERGGLYSKLGRHREAIADYDRAIALRPDSPGGYTHRARTYEELQMYEASVADWEKAMELLQENSRHLTWLPLDEVAAQPDSALHERLILLVDRISELPVNRTGKARVAIGDFFHRLGQYERARETMLAAVELAPEDLVVLNNVAWRMATSPAAEFRNADLALDLATKVCDATDWKNWQYVDTLAAAYAADGNFDEAVRWQERSIELAFDPSLKERLSLYESHEPFRVVEEEPASE
ncbi:tetratricopeptide repeat protein [Stieleria neptunia]|nr:tetratricopeptide repeat protein [Stieleria neptunia]